MTKEEFLIQYVLARAATCEGRLESYDEFKSAEQVWNLIQISL